MGLSFVLFWYHVYRGDFSEANLYFNRYLSPSQVSQPADKECMGVRENTITPFTKIQSEFGSLNSPRLDVQQEDVKNRGSLGLICHVFLSAFFISRFEV